MSQTSGRVLIHHGVKGMRWGHRKAEDSGGGSGNSTPKPTRAEKITVKRNAKAQKYDDRATKAQAAIDGLMAKPYKNIYAEYVKKGEIRELTETRDRARKDADLKRQGKLSTGQKKVAIGASVVAGLAIAGIGYATIQNGEANRMVLKGKALIDHRSAPWKPNPDLARKDMSVAELHALVAKGCNPNYGATGTKVNCRRSTFAYEMRRRGYDVSATRTTTGSGQTVAGLATATTPGSGRSAGRARLTYEMMREAGRKSSGTPYDQSPMIKYIESSHTIGRVPISSIGTRILVDSKGVASKIEKTSGHDAPSIFHALSSQPNGARGELGMIWKGGGGHSMAWEIVNGRPVIFDTQTHETFATPAMFAKTAAAMKDVGYTRLDNAPLNEDFLMRWLKDA